MRIAINDLKKFLFHSRRLALNSSNQVTVQAFVLSFYKLMTLLSDKSSDVSQVVGKNTLQYIFDDSQFDKLLCSVDNQELCQLLKIKMFNSKYLSIISAKLDLLKNSNVMNDDLLRFIILLYVYVLISIQLGTKQLDMCNTRLLKQLVELVSEYINNDCSYTGKRLGNLADTTVFKSLVQYNKFII